MTKVWYAARRQGITIPFPTATEIGYEASDIEEKAKPPIDASLSKIPILFHLTAQQRADLPASVQWQSFAKNELQFEIIFCKNLAKIQYDLCEQMRQLNKTLNLKDSLISSIKQDIFRAVSQV